MDIITLYPTLPYIYLFVFALLHSSMLYLLVAICITEDLGSLIFLSSCIHIGFPRTAISCFGSIVLLTSHTGMVALRYTKIE
jgi:hypothetical protein